MLNYIYRAHFWSHTLYVQKYLSTLTSTGTPMIFLSKLIAKSSRPCAARMAFAPLVRLSARFWSMSGGIFDNSSRRECMTSGTGFKREGLIYNLCSSSSQMRLIGLRCRPVNFFHTKFTKLCLHSPPLCTGAQGCWSRKGPPGNWSHKVGIQMLWRKAQSLPIVGVKYLARKTLKWLVL